MKWLFTAIVALTTAGIVESAADMPNKTSTAPWNWTGFYVGGHIGYAQAYDDSYGGLPGNTPTYNLYNFRDVFGGLQAGYNFAVGQKGMLGIEVDVSATNMRDEFMPFAPTVLTQDKIHGFGTARGRAGYVVDQALVYGTGGLAWGAFVNTRNQLIGSVNNATPGTIERFPFTKLGWALGAGVEFALVQNWSLKVEYLYLDFGTKVLMRPLAQTVAYDHFMVHTARIGVNYNFNWDFLTGVKH